MNHAMFLKVMCATDGEVRLWLPNVAGQPTKVTCPMCHKKSQCFFLGRGLTDRSLPHFGRVLSAMRTNRKRIPWSTMGLEA